MSFFPSRLVSSLPPVILLSSVSGPYSNGEPRTRGEGGGGSSEVRTENGDFFRLRDGRESVHRLRNCGTRVLRFLWTVIVLVPTLTHSTNSDSLQPVNRKETEVLTHTAGLTALTVLPGETTSGGDRKVVITLGTSKINLRGLNLTSVTREGRETFGVGLKKRLHRQHSPLGPSSDERRLLSSWSPHRSLGSLSF